MVQKGSSMALQNQSQIVNLTSSRRRPAARFRPRKLSSCHQSLNHLSHHLSSTLKTLLTITGLLSTLLTTVQTAGPQLLLANRKDVLLISQESAHSKNQTTTVASGLGEVAGVDFHHEEQLIFWTDVENGHIKIIRLNDTSNETSSEAIVATGLQSPDDIAVDWLGQKLYWTDSETNRIEVSHLDGVNRKVLIWQELDQPRALAVVPQEGFFFWTAWGEVPKIERCSMDGNLAYRRNIVSEEIFWPNGLSVDNGERLVYWTDAKLNYIGVMDFDGKNRNKIQASEGMGHLFGVSTYGPWVYWTDWDTRSVQRCHKKACIDRMQIVDGLSSPMDMQIFSKDRQPSSRTPCQKNNGGCSHLCLLSSEGERYTCACPTGVKLYADGKTCAPGPERMVLIARRSDVRKISLDTIDNTDIVIPFRDVKHSIAVDYDPFEGKMYWTDDESRVIRRGFMNGTDQEDLVMDEVEHPDGIAIDWVARNMYWTDTGVNRIQVSRLDGSLRKTIISEGLQEPRGIVVHPTAGLIFWTDWGERPRIERAALDGSHRTAIVHSNLGWPNGITVDYETSKLYFSDAKLDRIEMVNFDGSDRITIVSDNSPHVFGLSILDNQLYWTDWQRRSIERVDKRDGSHRNSIVEHLPDLMGIKAMIVEPSDYQRLTLDENPCAVLNGGCNQLCFNRPHLDYVCSCVTGFELDADRKTCIRTSNKLHAKLIKPNKMLTSVRFHDSKRDPMIPSETKLNTDRVLNLIDRHHYSNKATPKVQIMRKQKA